MQEYRIDKIRRPVAIVLTDGRRLEGEIFLQPIARRRTTPEEPIDLLNGDEPYFVLADEDGVILVAKEQVVRLETTAPEADTSPDVPHVGLEVELVLADGSSQSGCVFPETPAGRSRLIDYLNSLNQRFIAVHSAEKLYLVNRRLIAYVRQLT